MLEIVNPIQLPRDQGVCDLVGLQRAKGELVCTDYSEMVELELMYLFIFSPSSKKGNASRKDAWSLPYYHRVINEFQFVTWGVWGY
ncbi:hypothetical protein PDIG_40280 [Penicillium digitatum PHI26]|jgi:hypothetical protein|uniref:Uncharacterized protein n=2 Tax=Penicillium digitatum TaxID=36651 RepID=K9FV22_PEND2|nr:hypothetical protein PDIP_25820 [Penicillium digitatum Pd1]EKV13004.1 hypothetical protein PDIG_40280 [Penicillium digitatum PHI26]EKV18798.1 hypothetical protein PDIP_25820 [Penicillium digitatum Pd1]